MARAHAVVIVDACARVEWDGGTDTATDGGALDGSAPGAATDVTLDMTYRIFEFCGV